MYIPYYAKVLRVFMVCANTPCIWILLPACDYPATRAKATRASESNAPYACAWARVSIQLQSNEPGDNTVVCACVNVSLSLSLSVCARACVSVYAGWSQVLLARLRLSWCSKEQRMSLYGGPASVVTACPVLPPPG